MKRCNSDFQKGCPKIQRTDDGPCTFEKLSTNVDVMLHIYKLMDFKDRLLLCLVSDKLKYIFHTFVWKKKYETLVINSFASKYLLTNETPMDQVCLDYEDFQTFLQVYAKSTRILFSSYDTVPDLRQFSNLTKLTYKYSKAFTKKHLHLVAENCPHLERLHLQFYGNRYLNHIYIEDVIDVNLLLQMPKLRELLVMDRYPDKIKYQHFCDIVTKTKLEHLKLNACIIPDATIPNSDTALSLRELQIEVPFNAKRWPSNFASFLTNFENLKSLTISICDLVNEEVLRNIERTCRNLEKFTICSTVFQPIESFRIPARVTDLFIFACEGLTYENLKQLLTNFKIKKFTSHDTSYHGIFRDFPISPLIEVLDLDGAHTQNFPSAYRNNAVLKQLTWYDMIDCTSGSHMFRCISIASCTHLQSLTIKSGFMHLSPLMRLKSLQKIAMSHAMPFLNWSYIRILLKHPSLVEIDISDGPNPIWLTDEIDIPDQGFHTNVKFLTLSFRVFLSALKFWLDMFCCNSKINLTSNKFPVCENLIRYIVNNERFPKSLRSLDLSGFTISCQELRTNYTHTMEKFMKDANYMRIISRKFQHITLCRR